MRGHLCDSTAFLLYSGACLSAGPIYHLDYVSRDEQNVNTTTTRRQGTSSRRFRSDNGVECLVNNASDTTTAASSRKKNSTRARRHQVEKDGCLRAAIHGGFRPTVHMCGRRGPHQRRLGIPRKRQTFVICYVLTDQVAIQACGNMVTTHTMTGKGIGI